MGEQPQPVRDLIVERVLSGSTPQERKEQNDPRKLGIIIVGGAMAGVGPAGATKRAAELGIFQAADGLYGNSGGFFAAALTASGQTQEGIKVYPEHLSTKEFIDFLRLPNSLLSPFARAPVDVDYVANKVFVQNVPLDTAKIQESPIPVWGSATDAITGEPIDFNLVEETSGEMMRYLLRAGATLPVLGGWPVPLRFRLAFDGGVGDTPIALRKAIEDGCTDLLILHNGMVPGKKDQLTIMGARIIKGDFPQSAELLINWIDRFRDIMEAIHYWQNNPHDEPTPEAPNMHLVVPAIKAGMLEQRRKKLHTVADAGERVINDLFPELVRTEAERERRLHRVS